MVPGPHSMAPTSHSLAAVLAWLSRPPEHVGGPEDGPTLAPGGLEGGPEDPRGDGRVEEQGQDSIWVLTGSCLLDLEDWQGGSKTLGSFNRSSGSEKA